MATHTVDRLALGGDSKPARRVRPVGLGDLEWCYLCHRVAVPGHGATEAHRNAIGDALCDYLDVLRGG